MRVWMVCLFLTVLLSANVVAEYDGKFWIVRGNDTLYGIARSFYPKSANQQAKLRKDIINLNQNVFSAGRRGLFVGLRLYLPDYVSDLKVSSDSTASKPATVKKTTPKLIPERTISASTWRIKSGDTLYSIGRYFYPRSSNGQYKLRQDIRRLNPTVFAKGARGLEIGTLLELPDYVLKKDQTRVTPVTPAKKPVKRPVKQAPEKTVTQEQHERLKSVAKPKPLEKIVQTANENKPSRTTRYSGGSSNFSSNYSFSVGYSFGGDKAILASGGRDVTYGSGFHLRFSYDGLWESRQGFRIGLGTQMDEVSAGSDSGKVTQNYFQLLYIYNLGSSLAGVGIANHNGGNYYSDIAGVVTDLDIDTATGLSAFYEYKKLWGNNIVGISMTSLETNNPGGSGKVDLSRTEVYYRWQF